METLAIVLAILMVGVFADPDYDKERDGILIAVLFLAALGSAIYVAVAG